MTETLISTIQNEAWLNKEHNNILRLIKCIYFFFFFKSFEYQSNEQDKQKKKNLQSVIE